ncbi:ABC transporter substrate-binding protein [Neomoorella thermoacetica]|uniref:Carbohydrate ABC transporter substrate-binding protein, CUT1 family n=1 Tax=Moorella thermoacetica (strain ATCC 39073 / JCM 9320) TaxID=264732 RepID=Q2RIE5_MOOTA|nr:ABC transporter substrate-binding protein [Moorella thermoacetica]AKX94267.1 sn-glycerol-3-phosphate-binding periplasmic protein UgpB precursor [Moorella thermoacetica]AKX96905.1 sn-glycerol-3-phosphate-binding periplasmic protein UgpB precursor [Moorella thermoacetica]OIQ54380.1 sn-glycerol-3-phosphate-binding periplasmic protein UgpB precursor [Moorella thermoacetica]OIQ58076.1 sn-glycerol-3-phosphate-binding periplasmic protein UgpB precursor [Moorella thermoacetica]QDA00735.1 sn-glycero
MINCKWRKPLGIALLVATMASSLVTGCGPGNPAKGTGQEKTGGKVTTIEYWHVNSENFGGQTVRDLVQKFNEQHPDIKVVEKFQPNMYLGLMQNLQAALAGGHPPAVAQIGYNYLDYATANLPHLPVEDAAKKDPEGQAFLNNYLPNILNLGRVNGKLEGMPYSISNPVLYYNADMFKAAGLDPQNPPKTWAEVRDMARIIKEKTGNYGLYVQEPSDNWAQQAMMESNGAQVLTRTGGKASATFDSPEAIEAYQLMADMVLKDKTALHATWEEGTQAFITGKVGMYVTTIARRNYIETSSKFKVLAAPFPTFGNKPRRVPAGGNALFIFAKDPDQQKAAWEFIKYLESPEALTTWTKGTGYLPPRKDVTEDPNYLKPFMDQNPLMKPAAAQLPDAVPWVSFPGNNGLQAEQILLDARDAILGGRQSAAEALKEAVAKVNKLIGN